MCLAHVLRDVQYAIDCGDAVFAPALAKLPASTIAVGRRRDHLKDSTLQQYRAKADRDLDRLLATSLKKSSTRRGQHWAALLIHLLHS